MTATELQTNAIANESILGVVQQRDWIWRGWQIRYTFLRSVTNLNIDLAPGLPILLLHGFGASSGHWRHNMPALAVKHTVYALDLLGFGASEKPPTPYQVRLWVEQVFDFWQTFINQPTIVVGNSIGSLVGVIAAQTHPEMAKGAIAISLPDLTELEAMVPPVVRPIKRWMEATIGGLLAKPLFYLVRQPKVVRFVLKNLVYCDRKHVDDQLVQIITEPARERKAADAFLWLNRGAGIPEYSPNVKVAIAQLKVPLLLLWGTSDRLIPISVGRKLAHRFSLRLVELPGLGHCPQDENPDMVNKEILDWIDRLG